MSIHEMKQRVSAFGDKECGNGATPAEIAALETELGVHIPESYREYLREYGWATFSHEELYGLGRDVPPYLELRRNTLKERHEMRPYLPPTLLPIMNDGAGNHYCLDTSVIADGECPVVFWDHELGEEQKPEGVALRFDVWLIELLDRLEADK